MQQSKGFVSENGNNSLNVKALNLDVKGKTINGTVPFIYTIQNLSSHSTNHTENISN